MDAYALGFVVLLGIARGGAPTIQGRGSASNLSRGGHPTHGRPGGGGNSNSNSRYGSGNNSGHGSASANESHSQGSSGSGGGERRTPAPMSVPASAATGPVNAWKKGPPAAGAWTKVVR